MSHDTKLEDKLEGDDNFRAWKYRIGLIVEENELESYVKEDIPIREDEEAKVLHKNNLVKAKRIIANSIKYHLIPHVSSLKTPKEMFDSLTKLFEGKNINRKMTLRNQLKNVKIQNEETMQSYFTRVSRIKEQLEAIEEDLENGEIVMTTLNGPRRSWD
ncbi:hypothetical protein DC366_19540, partial [Pelagivirga sediminicola]